MLPGVDRMSVVTPRDGGWSVPRSAPAAEPQGGSSSIARQAEFATPWTRLTVAVASSPGARHSVNEDCHSALDGRQPLFIVADGVGGGALAAHASRELVTRLHAALGDPRSEPDAVRTALLDADRAIARSIAKRSGETGAATVALCKASGASLSRWLVAWVGDCRVYRLGGTRAGAAQLLTVDDTYRHLHEEPPCGGSLDDPARMVGNGAVDAPNVRGVELRAGEMLVLCSDGVHKHAAAADIGRLLREPSPLVRRCAGLIEFARSRGSRDDATVLVVQRERIDLARRARLAAAGILAVLLAGAALWLATDSSAVEQLVRPALSWQSGVQ